MLTKVTELLGDLLSECPDVPEPVAATAYVRAAREFCTESMAWNPSEAYILPGISGSFDLDTFQDSELFDAVYLNHDGQPLVKATARQLSERGRQTASGSPMYFRCTPGLVVVVPAPTDVSLLEGRFVGRPKRTATRLPDELLDRFEEAILWGAKARLYMMPGKAWYDVGSAANYDTLFRNEIERHYARAPSDGQRGIVRTVRYGGL